MNREGQPPDTCWNALNVLPYDAWGRKRVAQRSGTSEPFSAFTGGGFIQHLSNVNSIIYPGTPGVIPSIPPTGLVSNPTITPGFIVPNGLTTITIPNVMPPSPSSLTITFGTVGRIVLNRTATNSRTLLVQTSSNGGITWVTFPSTGSVTTSSATPGNLVIQITPDALTSGGSGTADAGAWFPAVQNGILAGAYGSIIYHQFAGQSMVIAMTGGTGSIG